MVWTLFPGPAEPCTLYFLARGFPWLPLSLHWLGGWVAVSKPRPPARPPSQEACLHSVVRIQAC